MDSNEYIDNVIAFNSLPLNTSGNTPSHLAQDQQPSYLEYSSRTFIQDRAKYSSNYYSALVQGVLADFNKYAKTYIRMADVNNLQSNTQIRDDIKAILFTERRITYFPIGAKIKTLGSTWISINPSNIGCPDTTAIVRKCNAVYNSYDYYGNVIVEPIIIDKITMSNNDNSEKDNLVLMNGYYNVTAQLNDVTRNLTINSRIILYNGNNLTAYYVTGVSDFYREFTDDENSTHLLKFTIRLDELNKSTDDITNKVADGLKNNFEAEIDGSQSLNVGENTQLTALFIKNGNEIINSTANPVTWAWESDNTSVATIDNNGLLVGVGGGECNVTATLEQNPKITATAKITIDSVSAEPFIAFIGVNPTTIDQYESATITACYYVNGQPTNNLVSWSFRGGKGCYTPTIEGNKLTIRCDKESTSKLTITAKYGTVSNSFSVSLVGF